MNHSYTGNFFLTEVILRLWTIVHPPENQVLCPMWVRAKNGWPPISVSSIRETKLLQVKRTRSRWGLTMKESHFRLRQRRLRGMWSSFVLLFRMTKQRSYYLLQWREDNGLLWLKAIISSKRSWYNPIENERKRLLTGIDSAVLLMVLRRWYAKPWWIMLGFWSTVWSRRLIGPL